MIAVPRSGCLSTSAAGTRTISTGSDQVSQRAGILAGQAMKIARQRQHQRDVHQLGGLQLDDPEIDPALRPHADEAAQIDRDDQQQRQRHKTNRPLRNQ